MEFRTGQKLTLLRGFNPKSYQLFDKKGALRSMPPEVHVSTVTTSGGGDGITGDPYYNLTPTDGSPSFTLLTGSAPYIYGAQ